MKARNPIPFLNPTDDCDSCRREADEAIEHKQEELDAEPVELVQLQDTYAWGSQVTEEEHKHLCSAMQDFLDHEEGDDYSIRVRPCRAGEAEGLYYERAGLPAGRVPEDKQERLHGLLGRAWEHAIKSFHEEKER